MIEHFAEALLALGAILAGAAALVKASASYKLAKARLAEANAKLHASCATAPCDELRTLRRKFEYYRGLSNGRSK